MFIYGKSYFGFRKKVQFFRYCIGKLLEGSRGFRRGPEVHKWVHHDPRASMGCGEVPCLIGLGAPSRQKPMWLGKTEKEGVQVLVGIGLDLESKSSPPYLRPRA